MSSCNSRRRKGGGSTPARSAASTASDKITVDPVWKEGNFEIVSSDGVFFRVNNYVLFAASSVLAEAEADTSPPNGDTTPTPRRIYFTDEDIETAKVFRDFLTLATTLQLSDACGERSSDLLLFLRKWDCSSLYDHVIERFCVTLLLEQRISSLTLLAIGAKVDDPKLCLMALCSPYIHPYDKWHDESSVDPFNLARWTLKFWRVNPIPADYLYALTRAWNAHRPKGSGNTGEHLATQSEKMLEEAKATV